MNERVFYLLVNELLGYILGRNEMKGDGFNCSWY